MSKVSGKISYEFQFKNQNVKPCAVNSETLLIVNSIFILFLLASPVHKHLFLRVLEYLFLDFYLETFQEARFVHEKKQGKSTGVSVFHCYVFYNHKISPASVKIISISVWLRVKTRKKICSFIYVQIVKCVMYVEGKSIKNRGCLECVQA